MRRLPLARQIDAIYTTEQHNEFGSQRNALLFLLLPGDYKLDIPVGFYNRSDRAGSLSR